MSTPALSSLTRTGGAASTTSTAVPVPPSRWKTRVLLPLVLLVSVAVILAYAARAALWPSVEVWVVPAVAAPNSTPAREASPGSAPTVVAQAPGWIEADPYFINVPALTPGVVKEVLVLEGERIEAGQVVARLIDDDARLEVRRSAAELDMRSAEVSRARAALEAAQARAREVRDEVQRKRELVEAGGLSEGQFVRLELRLDALERDAAAARAEVVAAEAAERMHRTTCDIAELALERTEIRSPAPGVVVSRLVEPGSRVAMPAPGGEDGSMAGAVVRLYDPAKLQVRADVPLADFAAIGVGTRAEITTETLPGKVFTGAVTRIVHEADIQRNTVQVKVAVESPDAALKPEMLTRVRFLGAAGAARPAVDAAPADERAVPVLVPREALVGLEGGRGRAWIVDHSSPGDGPLAVLRELEVEPGAGPGQGMASVLKGLRPGDRLIVAPPPDLTEGTRVRVLGERAPHAAQGGR